MFGFLLDAIIVRERYHVILSHWLSRFATDLQPSWMCSCGARDDWYCGRCDNVCFCGGIWLMRLTFTMLS